MKAVVYEKYGSPDVLELREVEKPTAKDDEVLIKVHATTVGPYDWHFRAGTPLMVRAMQGLMKPKRRILGFDVAGKIESAGKDAKQFEAGDEVFGWVNGGAHAEYVCAPEKNLVAKPVNMTYEQAAAVPFGGLTALHALRDKANIRRGQRVLVNGASGNVGTFAVQIAKSFGTQVTGVCSTTNLELVRSIGADSVIDYTKEDFTKMGQSYDIIFDAVAKSSFSKCKGSLSPSGVYVTTMYGLRPILRKYWVSVTSSRKMAPLLLKASKEDLVFLRDLIEAGKVTSVIDRRYPLERTAEAHAYVEKGHAKGKVVITF